MNTLSEVTKDALDLPPDHRFPLVQIFLDVSESDIPVDGTTHDRVVLHDGSRCLIALDPTTLVGGDLRDSKKHDPTLALVTQAITARGEGCPSRATLEAPIYPARDFPLCFLARLW